MQDREYCVLTVRDSENEESEFAIGFVTLPAGEQLQVVFDEWIWRFGRRFQEALRGEFVGWHIATAPPLERLEQLRDPSYGSSLVSVSWPDDLPGWSHYEKIWLGQASSLDADETEAFIEWLLHQEGVDRLPFQDVFIGSWKNND